MHFSLCEHAFLSLSSQYPRGQKAETETLATQGIGSSVNFRLLFSLQILEHWSPKLSHENDGLIFNPAEEVRKK